MIRRALPILISASVFVAFVLTLIFLYRKSEARPIAYFRFQFQWAITAFRIPDPNTGRCQVPSDERLSLSLKR